jgi:acetyl-CoA carboxylase biotin carboxyl carrier protein
MPDRDLDLEAVAALIKLVETHGLEELSVEEEGARLTVRRNPASTSAGGAPVVASARSATRPVGAVSPHTKQHARNAIASPMVGVFYRAPAPDQPPYVEVGDRVEIGQTIGIIEAMKVFSEIPAEAAGVCVEIAARSGQLVQAGEPLIYLSPEV